MKEPGPGAHLSTSYPIYLCAIRTRGKSRLKVSPRLQRFDPWIARKLIPSFGSKQHFLSSYRMQLSILFDIVRLFFSCTQIGVHKISENRKLRNIALSLSSIFQQFWYAFRNFVRWRLLYLGIFPDSTMSNRQVAWPTCHGYFGVIIGHCSATLPFPAWP